MAADDFNEFEVSEDHLELVKEPREEISSILSNINKRKAFYMYEQAKDILETEFKPRFLDAEEDENYRGRLFFLYGNYNTGKSYLVRYAAALLYSLYQKLWKSGKKPIIIFNLTDNINTAEQFLIYFLEQLGRPVDPKALKEWQKTGVQCIRLRDKIIATLKSYRTRIVVMDESQRLLKAKNPNLSSIFEAVKDLTTKSYWKGNFRTYFLMCGTDDAIPLLDIEKWIQGRTHAIRLEELPIDEYADFLWLIYEDFISLGVSKEWELVIFDEEVQNEVINYRIAEILWERSQGKAGLTVEIIREAVKRALYSGRHYPCKDDYKHVILEGTEWDEVEHTDDYMEDSSEKSAIVQNDKKAEILFDINDLRCKIKGCNRFNKPYSRPKYLINHYHKKHPEIALMNKEGRMI